MNRVSSSEFPAVGRARAVSLATVRSGQILDWSTADKTALLVFTPYLPLLLLSLRVLLLVEDETIQPYLDRFWLRWIGVAMIGAHACIAVFAASWWWVRSRDPENRALTYVALPLWFVGLSVGGYVLGEVSTPLFGALLAFSLAVLLFYELGAALRIVAFGIVAFFAPVPFILADLIPYGPIFRTVPFTGRDAEPSWLITTTLLGIAIAVVPVGLLAGVVRRWRSRDSLLLDLARLDPLTRVANRRYFFDRLEVELERAIRHETPVALLLLDLDHFKRVNDEHGHLAGDAALVHVATLLTQEILRRIDVIGRYGGEEFAVLLPDTDLEGARVVAERCRDVIATRPCPFDPRTSIALSASIGVAAPGPDRDVDSWVQRVDEALYRAKESGRNRVEVARDGAGT